MKLIVTAALTLVSAVTFAVSPLYQRMDYGPALFWTYQVAPGNIAQKPLRLRVAPDSVHVALITNQAQAMLKQGS